MLRCLRRSRRQRLYVSRSDGEIDVFQRQAGAHEGLPPVRTARGLRTSLVVPQRPAVRRRPRRPVRRWRGSGRALARVVDGGLAVRPFRWRGAPELALRQVGPGATHGRADEPHPEGCPGSLAVSVVVLGMSATVYWMTGSLARYSDALETVINVVAATGALVALWVNEQPADANDPYSHHKAEHLSAVVEGALVLATALLIGREAWLGWQHPRVPTAPFLGIAINAAAGIINRKRCGGCTRHIGGLFCARADQNQDG